MLDYLSKAPAWQAQFKVMAKSKASQDLAVKLQMLHFAETLGQDGYLPACVQTSLTSLLSKVSLSSICSKVHTTQAACQGLAMVFAHVVGHFSMVSG